jgi:3',5'-cyclic AMP phosphodiesterase CpdA
VRETIAELNGTAQTRVAFVAQVGDLVEGLCGSEQLATRQDEEAVAFVREAKLGAPFLFAKGNHDITGPGAAESFRKVFHPFLSQQPVGGTSGCKLSGASFTLEQGEALFCFLDAYDKEALGWLEAAFAKRTARHCFVVLHPPVVPYGARSLWYLFSAERQKAQREKLLDLLGQQNAFVLNGHIHKYNLLVRKPPRGGRFLQLATSSVIGTPEPQAKSELSGVKDYNGDQVKVEPSFSPTTEKERRAVYADEGPFVTQFEYADLPGYAVVTVDGAEVEARVYPAVSRQAWRTLNLSKLLRS